MKINLDGKVFDCESVEIAPSDDLSAFGIVDGPLLAITLGNVRAIDGDELLVRGGEYQRAVRAQQIDITTSQEAP